MVVVGGAPTTAYADTDAPTTKDVAPGAWTTGGKDGLGTSAETHTVNGQGVSKVWYTISRGQLNEVYYPQVDVANVQDMMFLVTDGRTFVHNERDDTTHTVRLPDPKALEYTQVNTASNGAYEITKTYVTDPARSSLLIRTRFTAKVDGLRVYALYNPSLNNNSNNDTGRSEGSDALVSRDGNVASALVSSPAFTKRSSGYVTHPQSDGFQNVYANKTLADTYDRANQPGNLVQIGELAVGGAGTNTDFTLGLGFGPDEAAALNTAKTSLTAGFAAVEKAYVGGWHRYLDGLFSRVPIPRSVADDVTLRNTYTVALMVLKAHEDKDHPGANIASLTVPWGDRKSAHHTDEDGYHRVWARDLYHVATAQLAAGDRDAAQRSADYLFNTQQIKERRQSDDSSGEWLEAGSFPRYSKLNGRTGLGCCEQMDQLGYPIVLQWQLNHATPDAERWKNVKLTADNIAARGPKTRKERWEEESGYSPSTIAAEIAGLVAAADLARLNGDPDAATRYEAAADRWREGVDRWTFTTDGTFGDHRYYERIDAGPDLDPNDPSKGPDPNEENDRRCFEGHCYWEKDIVDSGFLELARLGIRPADHQKIVDSLPELDATGVDAATRIQLNGHDYWYRYNHDKYGENAEGSGWPGGGPSITGRPWPLLSGERGEYRLLADRDAQAAAKHLVAMAQAGGDSSYLIPEQVWDKDRKVANGIVLDKGEHTGSATPLAWATAQYVRLALSIDVRTPIEMPGAVASRYLQKVKITVKVPAGTDGTGKVPFIAGELSKLNGGYPTWVPGLAANGSNRPDGERLTRVDATTWTTTLAALPGTRVAYKIVLNPLTRGTAAPGWGTVEKSGNCGEIPNRTLEIPARSGAEIPITVANWRGVNGC